MGNTNTQSQVTVNLTGIPETLLMTLYNRATEARRRHGLLSDPLAVSLLERINYPFAERFGKPDLSHALRSAQFDAQIRRFLKIHPQGMVVALGEGLETQFWRVDNGEVHWMTVDLPEVIDLRRKLLPPDDRLQSIACSALDTQWMQQVDTMCDILVIVQGLLMYFEQQEVHGLLRTLADRFRGGEMLFDTIPRWASTRKGHRQSRSYRMPPQPWGLNGDQLYEIRNIPGIDEIRIIPQPSGRGFIFGYLYPLLLHLPVIRQNLPMTIWLRFVSEQKLSSGNL